MKHKVFFIVFVMTWLSCISTQAQDTFTFQEDMTRQFFDRCLDGGFYTNASGAASYGSRRYYDK